ncbi:Npun_F0296 family exosortase-dependent surface protein [Cylindrospermum sp. FACHB-282]|uniref:Npun_F0296 family exosortase-dependent surface protein n=1 Tax=Cylindrospermum sp. FACHB-282 TaxID=2692794 RepID=UPI001684353D|nr:PEP-CTERM sorting domain-containing protein [Cylindrospermum sp. FACHB-282]MBD2386757.1 PEP-CTERM sorting domain-containing protein [Cylindrospermum sp. FACHB-282]
MFALEKISLALVGTTFFLISANPASAITLVNGSSTPTPNGIISNQSGAITIDFNNGVAPTTGFAKYSSPVGTPTVVSGNVSGQYANPFGDTSKYLTISPTTSVGVPGNTGSVSILFDKALDYFGLHWGSVDTYNSIEFYSGGSLLQSFTGSNVPGTTASGNQTSPQDNVFVNFFADAGQTFDKVVLKSTSNAFETDNHAYRVAVPEPGSILGLLAFGALGAGTFAKRKFKTV